MVVITYHSTHGVHRTAQAFYVPPTVDTMKPRSASEYLVRAMEDKEKWGEWERIWVMGRGGVIEWDR